MRYVSVCSGIEAASVAWKPLGWEAAAFSEIDPYCCALLSHHYPDVPNLGDLMEISTDGIGAVDVLVGGTPCQSFSVAGLRKGLDDPRGQLLFGFLGLADRVRPCWLVWENVPGVLSSSGGRDFGSFLGALGQLGYGWAYRVLDAQYFGLAQRRKRVFVVGYLGDWRRAAAVLFERASVSGHPAPRREAGTGVAALTADGVGTCGADDGQAQAGHLIARCLNAGANGRQDFETETLVAAHTLRAEGHDASEDGTGRGVPLVFNWQSGGKATLSARDTHTDALTSSQTPAVAFQTRIARNGRGQPKDIADALTGAEGGTHADSKPRVAGSFGVRRLTPRECERLQGFPDDYTLIPYRGKPAKDAPRYRALGNSMAVPVMRWIGKRIQMVEDLR